MNVRSEHELLEELENGGVLDAAGIEKATQYQKTQNTCLLQAIIESRLVPEDTCFKFVSQLLGIDFVADLGTRAIDPSCIDALSAKFATHYKIVPVSRRQDKITICVANPFDLHLIDDVRSIVSMPIVVALARKRDIDKAIDTLYGLGAGTIDALHTQQPAHTGEAVTYEKIDGSSDESSIVSFVNQVLLDAYKARATDIHIEPFERDIKIRYRVDGVLRDISVPPHIKKFQSTLITRIKIIANLDISEHRLPQDGRIKISMQDGVLDLRVSIVPTSFGESINIRLLSSTTLLDLVDLGFQEREQHKIASFLKASHGIVFLTGPTGSGKTTTLYACLQKINNRDKKIITVEDPIEYQLEGITQMQVNPKIGLTFASGLRSFLRHDPDVIMVGEVRDKETADIAVRSSLTGHLVFSTLHTNDAPSAVARLVDMGVEPYLVSSSLLCVIAQRLVRVLCQECKKPHIMSADEVARFGVVPAEEKLVYRHLGCEACGFTGYRNRTVVVEIMPITEEIRTLINANASHMDIKRAACKAGMKTLREAGWDKVIRGITSIDEIVRVTQDEREFLSE